MNDIEELGKYFLSWNTEKKNYVIRRLWKEFGLNTSLLVPANITIRESLISPEEYYLFAETFKARDNFIFMLHHRNMIYQIFSRLSQVCLPEILTKEIIDQHDNSVLSNFVELVGYTIKNIWQIKSNLYTNAYKHHHLSNLHHPEHFRKSHNSTANMDFVSLLESVIDRVALHWQHRFPHKTAPNDAMWEHLPEKYLKQYTEYDKLRVKDILDHCKKRRLEK